MPIWDSPLTPKEYWAKERALHRWIPILNWIEDRGWMKLHDWLKARTLDKLPYG